MTTPYDALAKGGRNAAKVVKTKYLNKYLENPNICEYCGKEILPRENEKVSATKSKKFCNLSCSSKHRNEHRIKKEPKEKEPRKPKERFLPERRKGELFSNRKNWQSARSTIQKWARIAYDESGGKKQCFVCGYTHYIEICHIKPVSDFGDEALVKEINDIKNLVALCPNHHWEFDNKILKL